MNFQRLICCLFNLLFTNFLFCQNIDFNWANSSGNSGNDEIISMEVDLAGNSYYTGIFSNTVDFDPDTSSNNLTSIGAEDIFIQKFDIDGNLVWSKSFGGISSDKSTDIELNSQGEIYVTGYFQDSVDFDPGAGIVKEGALGQDDIFILKLDNNGNFLWVKTMGGLSVERSNSIGIDVNDNIYMVGEFWHIVDFDPSAATLNLTSPGTASIFVTKLDNNGNLIWAKVLGGSSMNQAKSCSVDTLGNLFITGNFQGVADFDPSPNVYNLNSNNSVGINEIFVANLDTSGALIWAKAITGTGHNYGNFALGDNLGNVYITGQFQSTVDFDPSSVVLNRSSLGWTDIFILKLNSVGDLSWVNTYGTTSFDWGASIAQDKYGYLYCTGVFSNTINFAPGTEKAEISSLGQEDIYVLKLDSSGSFLSVNSVGGTTRDIGNCISVNTLGEIYLAGYFYGTSDFNPLEPTNYLTSAGARDMYRLKLNQKGISGKIYKDFNQNCILEGNEWGAKTWNLLIQPGNIITQTDSNGIWSIEHLDTGTYYITVDTTGTWTTPSCSVFQMFHVNIEDSFTIAPSIPIYSTTNCPSPDISMNIASLRPGFLNQNLYIQACNLHTSTSVLDSAYIILELDTLIAPQSASHTLIPIGNSKYRINVGSLSPNSCVNVSILFHLDSRAIMGQTLCNKATLYPVDSCFLDSSPSPNPSGISPCNLPWDRSSLQVEGSCVNDSVRFVIYNTGAPSGGDMDCFSPIRIYSDGQLISFDSLQLAGGDSLVIMLNGNGQTIRLEADQHPLHPGNSNPNAVVELCGDSLNWTSNLVNIQYQDDSNLNIDVFCGLVRASYDPNDKTGFPLGRNQNHEIKPNYEIEYLIRFQNTGTDTAFSVVIRDTLSSDLDIFSVRSGVSSNSYDFKMYSSRVLEWTFNNIMLPDSNTNEPLSHGFVKFKVNQVPNLPNGTVINNSAAIYFDINPPIITNTSWHTINEPIIILPNQNIIEEKFQVKIYPNPTNGLLYIERKLNNELNIRVYDNLGRLLLSKKSHDEVINVDLNPMISGIYFISLNDGKNSTTHKIIKR